MADLEPELFAKDLGLHVLEPIVNPAIWYQMVPVRAGGKPPCSFGLTVDVPGPSVLDGNTPALSGITFDLSDCTNLLVDSIVECSYMENLLMGRLEVGDRIVKVGDVSGKSKAMLDKIKEGGVMPFLVQRPRVVKAHLEKTPEVSWGIMVQKAEDAILTRGRRPDKRLCIASKRKPLVLGELAGGLIYDWSSDCQVGLKVDDRIFEISGEIPTPLRDSQAMLDLFLGMKAGEIEIRFWVYPGSIDLDMPCPTPAEAKNLKVSVSDVPVKPPFDFALTLDLPPKCLGAIWDEMDEVSLVLQSYEPDTIFDEAVMGRLEPGDRVICINGVSGDVTDLASMFLIGGRLELIVQRPKVVKVIFDKTSRKTWGVQCAHKFSGTSLVVERFTDGVISDWAQESSLLHENDRIFEVNEARDAPAMLEQFNVMKMGRVSVSFWVYPAKM